MFEKVFQWLKPRKLVYPEREFGIFQTTRIFPQSVKGGRNDLSDYLLISKRTPLLLNFTVKGDAKCDYVSAKLYKMMNYEIKKHVNLVDVESDEYANRELMLEYGVKRLPVIVALKTQMYLDKYEIGEAFEEDQLKRWVESIGID